MAIIFRKKLHRKCILHVFCMLLPFLLLPLAVSPYMEARCGYVVVLVIVFWLLQPVPVAVTSFLPVVLLPLLGIMSSNQVAVNYMKEGVLMFIGSMIVAIAIEDCKLHERVALKMLLWIGTETKWLMLGMMCITMLFSMWMTNAGTASMMVPIADAIVREMFQKDNTNTIELVEDAKHNFASDNSAAKGKQVVDQESCTLPQGKLEDDGGDKQSSTVKTTLLLSICYAANIGGTGTLNGTYSNIILKGLIEELFPASEEISFVSWMVYNIPGMIICVAIGWFYLWMVYIRKPSHKVKSKNENIKKYITERNEKLGFLTVQEIQVSILFVLLVSLWIFHDPKFITGWSQALGFKTKIGNSLPSILVSFLLLFLPSDPRDFGGRPILEWKTVQAKFPWGIIIFAGGCFSLAHGIQISGLSILLGNVMSFLDDLPPSVMVIILCLITAMATEILTNSTLATILLPVLSRMALSMNVNPLYMMLPVGVACSYAFMLPVATITNAIVFESGKMKILDMAKPGLAMNVICCVVQLIMINTLGVAMFDVHTFPSWAKISNSTDSSI